MCRLRVVIEVPFHLILALSGVLPSLSQGRSESRAGLSGPTTTLPFLSMKGTFLMHSCFILQGEMPLDFSSGLLARCSAADR